MDEETKEAMDAFDMFDKSKNPEDTKIISKPDKIAAKAVEGAECKSLRGTTS